MQVVLEKRPLNRCGSSSVFPGFVLRSVGVVNVCQFTWLKSSLRLSASEFLNTSIPVGTGWFGCVDTFLC